MKKTEKSETMEINYQQCCISCGQHNGWICAATRRTAHPAKKKCQEYTLNQAFRKEAK